MSSDSVRALMVALAPKAHLALAERWPEGFDVLAVDIGAPFAIPPGTGPLACLLLDARDEEVLGDVPRVLAALAEELFEPAGVAFCHPDRSFAELRPTLRRLAHAWNTFVVAPALPGGPASLAAIGRALLEMCVTAGVLGVDFADWRVVTRPPRIGAYLAWPPNTALPQEVIAALRAPGVTGALATASLPDEMGLQEVSDALAPIFETIGPERDVVAQAFFGAARAEVAMVIFEGVSAP